MTRLRGPHVVAGVSFHRGRIECACGWRLVVAPGRFPGTAEELSAAFVEHRGPIARNRLNEAPHKAAWRGSA